MSVVSSDQQQAVEVSFAEKEVQLVEYHNTQIRNDGVNMQKFLGTSHLTPQQTEGKYLIYASAVLFRLEDNICLE